MRRIVRAKVQFLSLVPRGANQLPVFYKSEDKDGSNFKMTSLTKASDDFEEKGELLSVVYAPELRDSQGDIASADTIKQMMYDAAKEGFDLDIRHNEKALSKDAAFVAESFIVQKGDPRFENFKDYSGNEVDVTGGWATVIKIEDKELRKSYKEGQWQGVSMAGQAEFVPDTDSFLKSLAEAIKKNNTDNGDIDMKSEELTALLARNNEALVESIAKALKPEAPAAPEGTKKEDTKKSDNPFGEKPKFTGDYAKAEDVAKFQKSLAAWKAAQDVDWDDADSIAKYHAELAKTSASADAELNDEEAGIEKEDSDEVKTLKKQLAKAQRQSNAGEESTAQKKASTAASYGGLTKEDVDFLNAGRKAGQSDNKAKGYVR